MERADHTTARNYVDKIMDAIEDVETYVGEDDDNDLSAMSDDYIRNSLKDKIKDSSVTIVLISKGMKTTEPESDQWIPWEVSYSLKEITRDGRTSKSNGVLAVIVPETDGSYNHYFEYSGCPTCNTRTHKRDQLFEILRNNMFNKRQPTIQNCPSPAHSSTYHSGDDHSYIYQIEWDKFILYPSVYIEHSASLRDRIEEFDVQKQPTSS